MRGYKLTEQMVISVKDELLELAELYKNSREESAEEFCARMLTEEFHDSKADALEYISQLKDGIQEQHDLSQRFSGNPDLEAEARKYMGEFFRANEMDNLQQYRTLSVLRALGMQYKLQESEEAFSGQKDSAKAVELALEWELASEMQMEDPKRTEIEELLEEALDAVKYSGTIFFDNVLLEDWKSLLSRATGKELVSVLADMEEEQELLEGVVLYRKLRRGELSPEETSLEPKNLSYYANLTGRQTAAGREQADAMEEALRTGNFEKAVSKIVDIGFALIVGAVTAAAVLGILFALYAAGTLLIGGAVMAGNVLTGLGLPALLGTIVQFTLMGVINFLAVMGFVEVYSEGILEDTADSWKEIWEEVERRLLPPVKQKITYYGSQIYMLVTERILPGVSEKWKIYRTGAASIVEDIREGLLMLVKSGKRFAEDKILEPVKEKVTVKTGH